MRKMKFNRLKKKKRAFKKILQYNLAALAFSILYRSWTHFFAQHEKCDHNKFHGYKREARLEGHSQYQKISGEGLRNAGGMWAGEHIGQPNETDATYQKKGTTGQDRKPAENIPNHT